MRETMEKRYSIGQIFSILLTVFIAMYVVFSGSLILNIQSEIKELSAGIKKMEEEKKLTAVVDPFSVLDQECTICHSERKYLMPHSTAELDRIYERMTSLPDFHISSDVNDEVHTSLRLLRCIRCHETEVFSHVATLPPSLQRNVILDMREKPGSDIRRQDVDEIIKSLQEIKRN